LFFKFLCFKTKGTRSHTTEKLLEIPTITLVEEITEDEFGDYLLLVLWKPQDQGKFPWCKTVGYRHYASAMGRYYGAHFRRFRVPVTVGMDGSFICPRAGDASEVGHLITMACE